MESMLHLLPDALAHLTRLFDGSAACCITDSWTK